MKTRRYKVRKRAKVIDDDRELFLSRDDEWVPFAHLALYAEKLPRATIREFDERGHQFKNDLSEVAWDIKNVTKAKEK